jgi:hypothetical protein
VPARSQTGEHSGLGLRAHRQSGRRAQLRRVCRGVGQLALQVLGVRLGEIGLEPLGQVVDLLGRQVGQRGADTLGERDDLGRDGGRGHAASPGWVELVSRLFMVVENSVQTLRWRSSIALPWALMP